METVLICKLFFSEPTLGVHATGWSTEGDTLHAQLQAGMGCHWGHMGSFPQTLIQSQSLEPLQDGAGNGPLLRGGGTKVQTRQEETANSMVDLNSTIFTITLNANGLNTSAKRLRNTMSHTNTSAGRAAFVVRLSAYVNLKRGTVPETRRDMRLKASFCKKTQRSYRCLSSQELQDL